VLTRAKAVIGERSYEQAIVTSRNTGRLCRSQTEADNVGEFNWLLIVLARDVE
jgi:hypothetical protein